MKKSDPVKGQVKQAGGPPAAATVRIPRGTPQRPLFLRYRLALLVLVPLAVYFRVVTLEFINIDDYHFIVTEKAYNQDVANVFRSFQRGLFRPADNTVYDYYRPLFLADVILEYQVFGEKPLGYHLTNLAFHILSVILLFLFHARLRIGESTALILALLFAVHPAITPAVAWISGRNDMLLMIFLLASLVFMADFERTRKRRYFLLHTLFFMLAVFTKETAVILPLLSCMILVRVLNVKRRSLLPYGLSWLAVIGTWVAMESFVKGSGNRLPFDEMMQSGMGRLPALLQYLGKAILPVNLTVRPAIGEVSILWGLVSLILLGLLVFLSRSYRHPLTWIGAAWFLLFLLPVLAVPRTFSDLVYEHRLYVPLAGILLILSPTTLFSNRIGEKPRIIASACLVLLFSVMSVVRTGYYRGPLEFWSRAAAESPGDAYTLQMKGSWVTDEAEQERILRNAYALDPGLKDINLYLGRLAYRHGRSAEAEKFLKAELAVQGTKSPENYFLLGRIAYERKDYGSVKQYISDGLKIAPGGDAEIFSLLAQVYFIEANPDSAGICLERVTALDPVNAPARRNLVIIYMKQGKRDRALAEVREMNARGMEVPPELIRLVNGK